MTSAPPLSGRSSVPERPKICAVIVSEDFKVSREILPLIDLFEVRIDLIGAGWQNVVPKLERPWLATNRLPSEGGKGETDEEKRIAELQVKIQRMKT